jgi:methyl acetate hydrolase
MKSTKLVQGVIWRRAAVRALLAASLAGMVILTLAAESAPKPGKPIDFVLQQAVDQKLAPGIVAMASRGDDVIYQGAFGKRDTTKDVPMTLDSIFHVASMTKPVTAVAVLQLIESGRVKLDEPAATYLPELAKVQVLEEFDPATKKAKLRPPKTPPTVRQLLTHTSGFSYDFLDERLHQYVEAGLAPATTGGSDAFLKAPLMFDPGTRWEYGISYDWLGKLVEQVSGETLEEYFRQHIFEPLGMTDTFFNVPAEKQARVVAPQMRQADGSFLEPPSQPMKPVTYFSGGGGLYSTAADYLKFEQMVLNGGSLSSKPGGKRILRAETVAEMTHNQIGDMKLAEWTSTMPALLKNPIRLPGSPDKFGWGFGINSRPVEGGRAAGSLAWDGIFNTFFWIDVSRKTCAVVLMQTLPFSDDGAIAAEEEFERALYASAAK